MKGICLTRYMRGLFAVLLAGGLLVAVPQAGRAQLFRRSTPCVPCPTTPSTEAPQPGTPGQPETGEAAPNPPSGGTAGAASATDQFSQADVGAAGGAASAAPNMIGDFFGVGSSRSVIQPPGKLAPPQSAGFGWNPNVVLTPFSAPIGKPVTFQAPTLNDFQNNALPATNFVTTVNTETIVLQNGTTVQVTPTNASFNTSLANSFLQTLAAPPGASYTIDQAKSVVNNITHDATVLGTPSDIITAPFQFSFLVNYQAFEIPDPIAINIPSPGSGGVVGRTKIGDDTSPMPRDRVMFDYSFFDDVPLTAGGVNVHRFAPGFEKTLFDGLMSVQVQFPFAVTMDSTVVEDGATDLSHCEFGNIAVTWKTLLFQSPRWAVSAGLMVTVPTERDTSVIMSDGTPLVRIANRSTHLGPFLGFLWTPNEKFFAQGFYQIDIEASGCPVSVNLDGTGLQNIGTLHDTTYQYVDLGIGAWLYRGCGAFRNLTGWAWTAELHGNDSFAPTAAVTAGNWQIGDSNSFDSWNLTVGTHLEFKDSTLTLAYVDPLGGHDRQFNGELRLMFNHYFGGSTRVSRTPPL